jgi:hypothetical protein
MRTVWALDSRRVSSSKMYNVMRDLAELSVAGGRSGKGWPEVPERDLFGQIQVGVDGTALTVFARP